METSCDRERLALYLLGALDEPERDTFETHLASCWHCLGEASEVAPSLDGLPGLDETVLIALDDPAPGCAPTGSRVRPADRGATRPLGRPGSRRRRLVGRLTAATAAAALLLGGALVADRWAAPDDRVLTATGEAPGHGSSLTVAIVAHETGGSTIRITVTGLRPGLRYRLYAVTRAGDTHTVRDWTASAGPQEVAGETTLDVADLSFVTVGPVDGAAIVTAPITR